MKPEAIMRQLNQAESSFPRRALEAAIADPEAIIPELLDTMQHMLKNPTRIAENIRYMGHIYAMYLLAQFREPRAYPLFIQFGKLPGDLPYELLDDTLTEDYARMLASVCGNDIAPIQGLIEDHTLDEYVRAAALDSLTILVGQKIREREEILTYYKTLFNNDVMEVNGFLWGFLVLVSTKLYPDMVYDEIRRAFNADLVDQMFIDKPYVDEEKARGKDAVLAELQTDRHYQLINDTIAEMESWISFSTDTSDPIVLPHGQVIRSTPKIGRNDPCPCGSGKKYKHCCGKRA